MGLPHTIGTAMTEVDPPTKTELDEFIKGNDVDDRAAADLRECPPEVQRKVLDRGDLSSARNSSAALIVRIRDARVEARGGNSSDGKRVGMGLPSSADIEAYIKENGVDRRSGDTLRSSSPTVKRLVLAAGNLSHSDNPSASLLVRIRDARGGGGGSLSAPPSGSMGTPTITDLEEFIKMNDVDVRAAAELRESPVSVQHAVISRGDLRSARNPSSALLARIRDAKLGLLGGSASEVALGAFPGGSGMPQPSGFPRSGSPPRGSSPGNPAGLGAAGPFAGYPPPGAYGYPPPPMGYYPPQPYGAGGYAPAYYGGYHPGYAGGAYGDGYGYPPGQPLPPEAGGPAGHKAPARDGSSGSSYSYSYSVSRSRSPSRQSDRRRRDASSRSAKRPAPRRRESSRERGGKKCGKRGKRK